MGIELGQAGSELLPNRRPAVDDGAPEAAGEAK